MRSKRTGSENKVLSKKIVKYNHLGNAITQTALLRLQPKPENIFLPKPFIALDDLVPGASQGKAGLDYSIYWNKNRISGKCYLFCSTYIYVDTKNMCNYIKNACIFQIIIERSLTDKLFSFKKVIFIAKLRMYVDEKTHINLIYLRQMELS